MFNAYEINIADYNYSIRIFFPSRLMRKLGTVIWRALLMPGTVKKSNILHHEHHMYFQTTFIASFKSVVFSSFFY